MQLTTILNRVQKHKSFVYGKARFSEDGRTIEVVVRARQNSRPICSGCGKAGAIYDHQRRPRRFEFVPLWQIAVVFVYTMRRVNCPTCGVKVERVPWATGKLRLTNTYRWFLANWARRLSWQETARVFCTSWQSVYRSVEYAVKWGVVHDDWDGIKAIGIDEIQYKRGQNYFTLVYQIDAERKRLLYVTKDRTKAALDKFFDLLGQDRTKSLRFVVSDMWRPYLDVVAERVGDALHVLDRFHIMKMLSEAIDQVRRDESKRLKADGYEPILKSSRWCFLKRPENLTDKQTVTLGELLQYNLKTVRAYLHREEFQRFWQYRSPFWAGKFLDEWIARAMRSRLAPIKKVARTLTTHRELLLNWLRAKGELSAGVVEGLNNKAKVATRKSYGFRTEKALEIALYHHLANLPQPKFTHTFW